MRISSALAPLLAGLLLASAAVADSWAPPRTEIYQSANLNAKVTIVPRPIGGALAYFEDKVDGKSQAGQARGEVQSTPMATVELRQPGNRWKLVWRGPLVNDVAPPSALIADDASHLVTFDNWHSAGYGDDVVVIYGADGKLVRKLSLDEILPREYVPHLPRSVSSRWWGGEHRLVEGDRYVELQVIEPGSSHYDNPKYVPVRIRLADGQVIPPSGKAWDAAMAKARKLEAERVAAWNVLRQLRARPLSAPATKDTLAWRHYMFEIRERLFDDEDDRFGGMVLAARGQEPGYHTADSIASEISDYNPTDRYASRHWIFASPDSRALADVLAKAMLARQLGAMRGFRLAFVGKAEDGVRVAAAGRHANAQVTLIDVDQPVAPGKPLPELPPTLWMPLPAGR